MGNPEPGQQVTVSPWSVAKIGALLGLLGGLAGSIALAAAVIAYLDIRRGRNIFSLLELELVLAVAAFGFVITCLPATAGGAANALLLRSFQRRRAISQFMGSLLGAASGLFWALAAYTAGAWVLTSTLPLAEYSRGPFDLPSTIEDWVVRSAYFVTGVLVGAWHGWRTFLKL